ncbi:MAG: electron transfer flavoprotein subunit beta/FixA family protein [Chloroflexota bacterium]
MDIVVCIKQVPDTAEMKRVRTDPSTGTIIREGVPSIVNPFDEFAVEESVRLKEKHGGTVTAITMGPPQALDALVKCLAMGADKAILICDRSFAGSDTLATSYTLAAAIRKTGKFDLIFCGQQAIDGDTAQVGPGIAENLHIPQITYVNKVEVDGKVVTAWRETEAGLEVVQCRVPVLLTATKGINEPRVPSFSAIAEAIEKEVPTWTVNDLEVNRERLGLEGSPTRVIRVWTPEPRSGGQILKGEATELARRLAQVLRDEGIV